MAVGLPLCGCTPKHSSASNTPKSVTRLFPDFNVDDLRSIRIATKGSSIRLVRKGEDWVIAEPYDVPVYPQAINQQLLEIMEAVRGQEIAVDSTDYESLSLLEPAQLRPESTSLPVEVKFSFVNGGEDIRVVLGAYDFSDDAEDRFFGGQAGTARRYVRFPDKNVVFLTPSSFQGTVPDASMWEDRRIIPARRIQEIHVASRQGVKWSARKSSSYSPIRFDSPYKKVKQNDDIIAVFDRFLGDQFYLKTLPRSMEFKYAQQKEPLMSIDAKDKLGNAYTLEVVGVFSEEQQEGRPVELTRGAIYFETDVAEHNYVTRLNIQIATPSVASDKIQQSIRDRYLVFAGHEIEKLIRLTEQMRASGT